MLNNLKKKIALKSWEKYCILEQQVHPLRYLFWEATLKCNLACKHCGSDCTKEEKMQELSKEQVLKPFREIAKAYDPTKIMIAVTGGEPVLREDLFEILKEVYSMGFPWGMVSNGYNWTEETVKKSIDAGMSSVVISLDGFKENHNWLRGKEESFDRAVQTIKWLVEAQKDNNSLQIVEVVTCVFPANFEELDQLYSFIKELGIVKWRLFSIFPRGRAAIHKEKLFTKELLKKLLLKIRDMRRIGIQEGVDISYSEEGYLGGIFEGEVRLRYYQCAAGVHVGSILCDGKISACPNLPRSLIQGDCTIEDFVDVWENRYQIFRERNWLKNGECKDCKKWKICQGNSLHIINYETNEPYYCHYKLLQDCE